MTTLVPVAVSPLRQRLIDETDIQPFGREAQCNDIRSVGRVATLLSGFAATNEYGNNFPAMTAAAVVTSAPA